MPADVPAKAKKKVKAPRDGPPKAEKRAAASTDAPPPKKVKVAAAVADPPPKKPAAPPPSAEELARREHQRQQRLKALAAREGGGEFAKAKKKRPPKERRKFEKRKAEGKAERNKERRSRQGEAKKQKAAAPDVVVVPIFWKGHAQQMARVLSVCKDVEDALRSAGRRVELDAGHKYTPGQKFAHWEHKGVALRVEVGPREAARSCCTLARTLNPGDPARRIAGVAADAVAAQLEALEALDANAAQWPTTAEGLGGASASAGVDAVPAAGAVRAGGDDLEDDFVDGNDDGDDEAEGEPGDDDEMFVVGSKAAAAAPKKAKHISF